MSHPRKPIRGVVEIGGNTTVYGPVVGVNTGTITTIVQTAQIVTSLKQLRAPLVDFVGRQQELAVLLLALRPDQGAQRAALCAICGMGGLGKTELAICTANRLRDDYPDAQLFVSLRGSTGEPARAAAAGLRDAIRAFDPLATLPDDVDALAALYRGHLGDKRVLIVLDDAPDVASVRPFLPPVGCALLVTSRTRLSLGGQMTTLDLALLARDESRALFHSLVAHITDQHIVNQLLDYCGDLPIAVRVVGATLADDQSLTPRAYLARLADEKRRLKAFKYEDTDVYAVLGLGDDLLSTANPALAQRWRMLGVCPAPFEAATAQSIWAEQEQDELQAQLAQLVRRSLLRYDPATEQYRMHDLLRDVARIRRPVVDDELARLRHAGHYLTIAREADRRFQAGGAESLASLALYDAAWPHIREAAIWVSVTPTPAADELCIYDPQNISILDLRLQPQELAAWCGAAVGAARRRSKRREEATALLGMGRAQALLGEADEAAEFCEQSLTIFRELGDHHGEAKALLGLGESQQLLGKWIEAEKTYRETLRLLETMSDPYTKARCQNALGRLLSFTQSSHAALPWFEQARVAFERLGDRVGLSGVLENLSMAYLQLGDDDRALQVAQQQLQIATEHGDQIQVVDAIEIIGQVFWMRGDYDQALEYLQDSLNGATAIGYPRGAIAAAGDMAGVYAQIGDFQRALVSLQRALDGAEEIGDLQFMGAILANAGIIYFYQGDYVRALLLYEHGLDIAIRLGNWLSILHSINNIAIIFTAQHRYGQAAPLYARAIALGRELEKPYILCDCLQHGAEQYAKLQCYAEAQSMNQEALQIAKEINRSETQLAAQLLAIQLQVALSQTDVPTAAAELEVLLQTWTDQLEQAGIHYTIWRVNPARESSRQTAAQLYQELYEGSPNIEYRQRYAELTGEHLPEAGPLPTLRSRMLEEPVDLPTLLDKVGVRFESGIHTHE
jgi:tetratricopeptide (TPR) repeat protein